ncbi:MAG: shikimate kinase [Burkholderiales bacterium]|nr:shikimate kinase [Burkholderiales bacterium]
MPVALIGMPGAGKSSVGRQLARRLQVSFTDSDLVIEQRLGCSIRSFFEREGEARFRDVEAEVIASLAADPQTGVLATGGGAVLREGNRDVLRRQCRVVYLHSSPDDVLRRVRHDVSRPLLQVADPRQRLRELYALRDPLYRATAHFVVETGRPSIAMLVNTISMQLEMADASAGGASPS